MSPYPTVVNAVVAQYKASKKFSKLSGSREKIISAETSIKKAAQIKIYEKSHKSLKNQKTNYNIFFNLSMNLQSNIIGFSIRGYKFNFTIIFKANWQKTEKGSTTPIFH